MAERVEIEKLLKEGHNVQFCPKGTSMYPLFVRQNDAAIVMPSEKLGREIRAFDVCLYRNATGKLILHRVYKVNEKGVYFVGDHQTEIEGPLAKECVLGVMYAFVRKGHECSVKNPIYKLAFGLWFVLRHLRWKLIHLGSRIKHLFVK